MARTSRRARRAGTPDLGRRSQPGYARAGFGGVEAWKREVRQNEARRAELQAIVAATEAEPPLPALHPRMADVLRQKTMQLAAALEHMD